MAHTSFQQRADEVAEGLEALALGPIQAPATPELIAADVEVEKIVEKVRGSLASVPDYAGIASKIVDGTHTPAQAAKTLVAPAPAKVDKLCAEVERTARATADRDEWSVPNLARSCAPIVRDRMVALADEMSESLAKLPQVVKDHLTQRSGNGYGETLGPLTADPFAAAIQVIAPGGNVSGVRGADLDAVRRASAAFRWLQADDTFNGWWYLAHGEFSADVYSGMGAQVKYKSGAETAQADYVPELLLLDGDDVLFAAAGVKLAPAMAAGLVGELKPISDPFGDGGDAEEYARRRRRAREFLNWRNEWTIAVEVEAAYLMDAARQAELKSRLSAPPLRAVEMFRLSAR
ncbi:hypothetical protein [Corynebacterium glyciniphilum]|uniref:hypothetical protein n=1 Tax=Corynebacterium glyciniphilum TaxID=1404244 RepID=UPI0011AB587B|nr:hypothetical protein [Corynebacterium glyciniphilum]